MQGRYKAAIIRTENLLLHVSRYIHLNPIVASLVSEVGQYKWSSYPAYVLKKENGFCKMDTILSFFKPPSSYEEFVQDQLEYAKQLDTIKHLTLDDEG